MVKLHAFEPHRSTICGEKKLLQICEISWALTTVGAETQNGYRHEGKQTRQTATLTHPSASHEQIYAAASGQRKTCGPTPTHRIMPICCSLSPSASAPFSEQMVEHCSREPARRGKLLSGEVDTASSAHNGFGVLSRNNIHADHRLAVGVMLRVAGVGSAKNKIK